MELVKTATITLNYRKMPLSFIRHLRIFMPFAMGYFLSYAYRVINAVLAPNLVADIGLKPSELGLLTSAYFITFAAFQLPLGVLLDRFGPRKIEAALLLVAASGALTFAFAQSLTGLIIGRGLIGLGVSACLMAAFKAFVTWFPGQQLPKINGFQMAAGGLGALAATVPVEFALSFTDWRGVFAGLAILTLTAASAIFFIVPEPEEKNRDLRFSDQIRGIGSVFGSFTFWRIAPWATFSQMTYLSIHGLWAGPWLRDVAGMNRTEAAGILMWMAVSMIAGFITLGFVAERLSHRNISTMTVASSGMLLFMVQLLLLIIEPGRWASPGLILFGFFGTAGILPYAALSQSFPSHLSGRVNTALNLLVFIAAFSAQWSIGVIIGLWPVTETGGYSPCGYKTAFTLMLILQVMAALWFQFGGKRLVLKERQVR
ncbi:MAG: MFS transporter [Desulfobacterales bacterium]